METTHYVCTGGCEGVAETAGTCQAADCAHFEKDLVACNCTDGTHSEVKGSTVAAGGDAEPTEGHVESKPEPIQE